MDGYINLLIGLGVYALGCVITLYIVMRWGGAEFRDGYGLRGERDIGGQGVFFVIIWPLLAFVAVSTAAMAVVFSPVLLPAFLIGRWLYRKAQQEQSQ